MSRTDTVQLPIRVDPKFARLFRQVAAWHGRSMSAELRLIIEAHGHRSLLKLLEDPAAQDDPDLKARLAEDPRFEERVRDNLDMVEQRIFDRSLPEGLFDEAA
jgi:hypothetical protein